MGRLEEGEPAWGEQTRRQRIVTYAFFFVFALVAAVLWWAGIVEPNGAGRSGYVVFPAVGVFFALRLRRELTRERHHGA